MSRILGAFILLVWGASRHCACAQATSTNGAPPVLLESRSKSLWDSGVGQGFGSSAQTLSFEAGPLTGVRVFGGSLRHDLALLSLSYGHMLGHTVGRGTWHQGNWELRGELFGGAEYAPSSEWIIGLAPHLRYDFATGTHWVPFVDAGAGVTATSIGPPDLSNTFEFNLQASVGTHYFLRENVAVTIETRFMHVSCAGISSPNHGVNGVLATMGVAVWF